MGRRNPFRRRRSSGGGGEYIEQVQKIEIILRDPPADPDYTKYKELFSFVRPLRLKKDIPKNYSTKDLEEHFDIRR